jgi:hypothetical protein
VPIAPFGNSRVSMPAGGYAEGDEPVSVSSVDGSSRVVVRTDDFALDRVRLILDDSLHVLRLAGERLRSERSARFSNGVTSGQRPVEDRDVDARGVTRL